MIFVTGPMYSGKRTFVKDLLGWDDKQLAERAVVDAQDLAVPEPDLIKLADRLAGSPVVISCEVGGGVVPVDKAQRTAREQAGRLACLLAQRADTVVRMCCGLPEVLKGSLPAAHTEEEA